MPPTHDRQAPAPEGPKDPTAFDVVPRPLRATSVADDRERKLDPRSIRDRLWPLFPHVRAVAGWAQARAVIVWTMYGDSSWCNSKLISKGNPSAATSAVMCLCLDLFRTMSKRVRFIPSTNLFIGASEVD